MNAAHVFMAVAGMKCVMPGRPPARALVTIVSCVHGKAPFGEVVPSMCVRARGGENRQIDVSSSGWQPRPCTPEPPRLTLQTGAAPCALLPSSRLYKPGGFHLSRCRPAQPPPFLRARADYAECMQTVHDFCLRDALQNTYLRVFLYRLSSDHHPQTYSY